MYTSVHIVRKLNDPDSTKVNRAIEVITSAIPPNVKILKDSYDCKSNTLIIAVGGDGTMLHAMRIAAETRSSVIGVNLGRVGFLTDFSVDDTNSVRTFLINLFNGNASMYIEGRVMVRATIAGQIWDAVAGNEVSISREESDSMINYRLTIDGVSAGIHRANSILVSTPTGSTAYSLSAGGALMMPNMRALQLVPVAPLTLTSRPIIVDANARIDLDVWGGALALRADGQFGKVDGIYTEDRPCKVTIKRTPFDVQVLHNSDWNFFDVLTSKLGWIKE